MHCPPAPTGYRDAARDVARDAAAFCRIALAHVQQEYPHKLDHVLRDADDMRAPRALHPVFYGSYDWHSCVHMHWLLVRLLRLFPDLPQASPIASVLHQHFRPEHVATEIDYLHQPARQSFERTYGWAWLLKLHAELIVCADTHADAALWRDALRPLADAFVTRYLQFLPNAHYPIRAGTHANSAFGLLFALEYAEATAHIALHKLITAKAHAWFGRDRSYPADYEPGGDDFLSGGLMEAALMQRVLDGCDFADWWHQFCPPAPALSVWLTPVSVTDRNDPKLVHLDGLNLSRAWCWKLIEEALPSALQQPVTHAIDAHLNAALPHTTQGDYVATHWLASFALLALT